MSGVLGQRLGRIASAHSGRRSSWKYSVELALVVAPGEVGVALAEAELGQRAHQLRAREGLGEEDQARIALARLAQQPLPEGQGLGVGVVDAEDADPLLDPEEHHLQERRPERRATGPEEVEVDDVVVALGRVLGGLDGAVGAVLEPLRMLGHPGVIGRDLEGEIQRHLQPVLGGAAHEAAKVLQRPELGMHGGVAALARADGPGAAHVAGLGPGGVVLPLPRGAPDGVDGRRGRATSNPSRSTSGRRVSTSRNVPWRSACAALRGKSSYQAPIRARSRSTRTGRSSGSRRPMLRSG